MAQIQFREIEETEVAMVTNAAVSNRNKRKPRSKRVTPESEIKRVKALIRKQNGSFAPGVIADFIEALRRCDTSRQRRNVINQFSEANEE
jgi:hypothetical protein